MQPVGRSLPSEEAGERRAPAAEGSAGEVRRLAGESSCGQELQVHGAPFKHALVCLQHAARGYRHSGCLAAGCRNLGQSNSQAAIWSSQAPIWSSSTHNPLTKHAATVTHHASPIGALLSLLTVAACMPVGTFPGLPDEVDLDVGSVMTSTPSMVVRGQQAAAQATPPTPDLAAAWAPQQLQLRTPLTPPEEEAGGPVARQHEQTENTLSLSCCACVASGLSRSAESCSKWGGGAAYTYAYNFTCEHVTACDSECR